MPKLLQEKDIGPRLELYVRETALREVSRHGIGSTSGTKLGSHVLRIFSKAILVNKDTIQLKVFSNILLEHDNIMKQECDVKEWSPIIKVMDEINANLTPGELSVTSLRNSNSGSVNKLSSLISAANNMIAKNVKNNLLHLYQ
ncbi:hypothetical protein HPULCUR_001332 [Helicostylum pulchrum]|uniref:Uncharacterized protein n=1 Tax=Helicostylum pulchrum TaxID=562976 RepID=A0ABP9XPE8_9FUNG